MNPPKERVAGLAAILAVCVEHREAQRRRLPDAEVAVGRGMGWGFRSSDTWCSRSLLDLEPTEHGWLAYNHHDGLQVSGPRIIESRYRSAALVLMPRGTWTLSWNARLRLELEVTTALTPEQHALPEAAAAFDLNHFEGTDPVRLAIEATDLHRTAILFRHLIDRTEPPPNVARAAAPDLNMSEAVTRAYANTLRRRVSEAARVELATVEELGDYLVRTLGIVTRAHLRPR